ncbi:hypothetical protein MY5147_009304 [Beauveria neobassiana]
MPTRDLFADGFAGAKKMTYTPPRTAILGQRIPTSIFRQAIFDVGVERIDHGLDVVDKRALMEGQMEKGIGLTLCPHAYYRRTATEVWFSG